MLSHDSQEYEATEIDLSAVDAGVLQLVVHWLYHQNIDDDNDEEIDEDLLSFKYLSVYFFAKEYEFPTLKNDAMDAFVDSFDVQTSEIYTTEVFKELEEDSKLRRFLLDKLNKIEMKDWPPQWVDFPASCKNALIQKLRDQFEIFMDCSVTFPNENRVYHEHSPPEELHNYKRDNYR